MVKFLLCWPVKQHIHLADIIFICLHSSLMCHIHEHQTPNHLHYYSDTEWFISCIKWDMLCHFFLYTSVLEYKGNVFKMKCCLIIMRCVCQVLTVCRNFVFIFPFIQIKLTQNECPFFSYDMLHTEIL